MAALDSLIGKGLSPSPYSEAMARCLELRKAVVRLLFLFNEDGTLRVDQHWCEVEFRAATAILDKFEGLV
jgi:hypothetical protein